MSIGIDKKISIILYVFLRIFANLFSVRLQIGSSKAIIRIIWEHVVGSLG